MNGQSALGGAGETLQRLRRRFPLSLCPPEVLEVLRNREPSAPQAIAFSGGPDSLFLLLWWRAHFPEAGRTTALHFNHRTRPGENDREAARAEELAAEWGVLFVGGESGSDGPASEEGLRSARFGFLLGAMREANADVLLLGHQADDRVETFLGRAGRGSGPEGLAAPRPVSFHRGDWSHRRVRPLLRIPDGRSAISWPKRECAPSRIPPIGAVLISVIGCAIRSSRPGGRRRRGTSLPEWDAHRNSLRKWWIFSGNRRGLFCRTDGKTVFW